MSDRSGTTGEIARDSKETEQRFRAIFDGAFEFIGLLSPDGTTLEANQTALNYIGASASDVIGRPFWETPWWKNSVEQQARLKAAIKEAATGRFVRFEAQHVARDGTVDTIDFSLRPAVDDTGRVIYIIPEGRRITERKRAEKDSAILAAIVSSANDAILSSRDGVIQTWNEGAERLFGWSAAEAIGQPLTIIVPPSRLDEMRDIFARLRRGEPVPHFDTVRQRKDGSVVDVSLTLCPVKQGEQVIMNSATIHDITERKLAQAALRDSEERFRLLAENIDRVLWFTELDPERVIYVSPAFEQLWGVPAKRLYENPRLWIEMTHPEDRSTVHQAFEDWVTGRAESYDIEYRIFRHDGELRWMHDHGIVIGYKEGRPSKLSGISRDITERKRAAEERKQADRRKDEFIAMLAHELRNPLAPIRNVINLLQRQGPLAPSVRRARDVISRQIDHLARLIDDLLDVSRITSDKLELRKERVSLAEIVNLAVESSNPLIDQHQHKLSLVLPGKLIYLNADKLRLAQVVMNLLTNAAKYTPEGGRITLSAEQNGEEVAIRVIDNGIGIAPDQLPQIFDMFYQANRSYEQLHGGLGIGLTLTRRLVEMHGGQVEAHSAGAHQGSEFVIRLPIFRGQLETQEEAASTETTRTAVRRILVVDDYEENAETLAELLRFEGHEVEIANDGLKAVEMAEKFRPAVVVLDIGMPKLNGYEAARKIREQPWGQDMVLIAVTGWGGENDRKRSREAGFNAHLLKPVDYQVLAKMIADR